MLSLLKLQQMSYYQTSFNQFLLPPDRELKEGQSSHVCIRVFPGLLITVSCIWLQALIKEAFFQLMGKSF